MFVEPDYSLVYGDPRMYQIFDIRTLEPLPGTSLEQKFSLIRGFDFHNKKVLDIGCNKGFYSLAAMKAGAVHSTCIDTKDPWVCSVLARMHKFDVRPIAGNALTILPTLGKFDCLFCLSIIQLLIKEIIADRQFNIDDLYSVMGLVRDHCSGYAFLEYTDWDQHIFGPDWNIQCFEDACRERFGKVSCLGKSKVDKWLFLAQV